jgi:hypothetical protein
MNVSVDPITDAADRAKCGYRCDAKAATRDGEPARPRYASSGHDALVAAPAIKQKAATTPRTRSSLCPDGRWIATPTATAC